MEEIRKDGSMNFPEMGWVREPGAEFPQWGPGGRNWGTEAEALC